MTRARVAWQLAELARGQVTDQQRGQGLVPGSFFFLQGWPLGAASRWWWDGPRLHGPFYGPSPRWSQGSCLSFTKEHSGALLRVHYPVGIGRCRVACSPYELLLDHESQCWRKLGLHRISQIAASAHASARRGNLPRQVSQLHFPATVSHKLARGGTRPFQ